VAERKCAALMKAGATVTVVSPSLTKRLESARDKGLITHKNRKYRTADIGSSFLVIAATGSENTNGRVAKDASALHRLVNVVDTPALCSFIVPSVVRRGLLTIAISTGGASPALAKAIRKDLEKRYGPEISKSLVAVKNAREKAMAEIPDKTEREKFLRNLATRTSAMHRTE